MTEEHIETPSSQEPTEQQPLSKEEELAKELEACQDKYLRLLAESENTRKRLQKEKTDSTRFAKESLILEFLAPIDNLENALGFAEKMSEETANWARGFLMILGQFKEVLSQNDVSAFHSVGMLFDPHCHEAVETEELASCKEGEILQEYSKGYKSGGKTLRPARVKVAKKPTPKKEESNQE